MYVYAMVYVCGGIIGIVGNVLTYCVLRRTCFRKHSYTFYCKAYALSNIVVLAHMLRHWLNVVLHVNIDEYSSLLCSINEYQLYMYSALCLYGCSI